MRNSLRTFRREEEPQQMFQIANEGSQRSRTLIRKIAYVDTNPEHDFADTKFVEDVAVNRGMNVRAFRTVGEAEAWLNERAAT